MYMIEHDYSQLPIVDDQGKLNGIITEQSIVNTYFIVGNSESLLDMTVDHCQATPVTNSPDDSIFDVLDRLKNVYAAVVVENQKPVGIVTDYDTTYFFRNYSDGLIQVQDVEVTLRQYIEDVLNTDSKTEAALYHAFGPDKRGIKKTAREYDELTFEQTTRLIITDENWEKFEPIFTSKPMFLSLMEPVREVRNQLAHFRGELTNLQRKQLRKAIDWLAARPKITSASKLVDITDAGQRLVRLPTEVGTQGKYTHLEEWLTEMAGYNKNIRIKFEDIEKILGDPLPASARKHRAWWANDYSHTEAMGWLRAGWLVDNVDFESEEVALKRSNLPLYQVFFNDMLARLKYIRPGITQTQKASLQNWLSFSSGTPGFTFGWVLPREHILRVELYIDVGNKEANKAAFEALKEMRVEIESSIGKELKWEKLERARASRVSTSTPFHILYSPEKHEKAKCLGVEMMLEFVDEFQPRLRGL
jgi:CBS domain-containing protein